MDYLSMQICVLWIFKHEQVQNRPGPEQSLFQECIRDAQLINKQTFGLSPSELFIANSSGHDGAADKKQIKMKSFTPPGSNEGVYLA